MTEAEIGRMKDRERDAADLFKAVFDGQMGENTRTDGYLEWWTGGTYLHPGNLVIELSAEDVKRIKEWLRDRP